MDESSAFAKIKNMHFLPENIDEYVVAHSAQEPQYLNNLTRETYQKVLQPRMLSGPYQGRVLSMISKLIRPKTILEIGTFTGYSALCLAEGLQKEGILHTIDIKEELVDFQRKHFDASPHAKKIEQHLGQALNIIPTLNTTFDLVFIDADKSNYLNYFHMIMDKMNTGGVILSDNVLWSGKVVEPLQKKDTDTKVLLEYNKLLNEDPRLETVLLPIRDGLTISRVI
ncbi:O-methyltransferase [Dokdonia ponticola]|uniref:O-methyltransferase n=1 Tax=Dokdonia ponticola TaxID=2041041 RepID=A0ABV9I3G0_9FLAO